MGDRVTFIFAHSASTKTEPKDTVLCLYAHWLGEERHERLAFGIHQARSRWQDYSYATRICVSHIIGDEWQSEYGFGLYPALVEEVSGAWDDRYPLTIHWADEMVHDGEDLVPFEDYLREHLSTEVLNQSAEDRVAQSMESMMKKLATDGGQS